jgi:hypothetical protein
MINTPLEIEKGMIRSNIKLQNAIEEFPSLIEKSALATKEYEMALSAKILQLKLEKTPITIIPKLASGDEVVAELKFKASIASEMVKVQYKKVKALETAISSYQSMHSLRRIEYSKASVTE